MATRYWVGGAGTWDATTTTNWSATSGGASGASAPTSVDNVIFDTASNAIAYAVTVGTNAVAQDITIAGPAVGNVTITWSATSVINCYGSWTNAATGVVLSTSSGCNTNFLATTTGKTFTTNGVIFGTGSNINFNGAGGGWTLGSALTTLGAVTVNAGTFNTGSYSVTASFINSSNTAVRAITLGSSTITLSSGAPWVFTTSTNLTFNAGTSTITCNTGASITFAGGGLTYYNVNFTSTSGAATTINGANTFNNLNQTSPSSSRRVFVIANNQVVNGTLTLGAANAYNARIFFQSDTAGTPRTLTVATIATLADVDFRDVTAAGASAPWSGTRLGNGLGNTSITFAAGKTVYWNLVAGGNWSANAWATSSGGAVATANFPLAQDTAIIDNTGLTASNTITMDTPWWMGTLNCTRTNAWTFNCTNSPVLYGDFTIPSVTTVTGTSALVFQGQGLTQTITTNSVSLTTPITITSVGGTLVLNGPVTTAATQTVTLNNGTLNLVSYTLSTGLFNSNNSNVRVLAFGTGKIVVTGNNNAVVNFDTATNFSFTGTSNFEATYSGSVGNRTLNIGNTAGGSQAVAMNLKVTAGTDTVLVYFYWNNIDFTGFSGTLSNTGFKNYYGNFTLSTGMTVQAGTNPINFTATSGTKTITSAGKTMDFPITFNGVGGTWQLQDALTSGSTRITTLTNGTLNLNGYTLTTGSFYSDNTNVRVLAFNAGKIVVTAFNSAPINFDTVTNFSYTGTSNIEAYYTGGFGVRYLVIGNTAGGSETVAMNLKVTAGTDTVYIYKYWNNLDFTGFAGTYGNLGFKIFYGSFTLVSGMTVEPVAGPETLTFAATSGPKTITSAGKTIDYPTTFDGIGGTWAMQDAFTLGATQPLTFTNGTVQLKSGTTSTVGSFVTTGTNQKYLQATTPGTQATISDASGTNSVSYLTIQDSYATGGADWDANASTNVNAGNNFGWFFAPTPAESDEITMRLRSFTQPRRF